MFNRISTASVCVCVCVCSHTDLFIPRRHYALHVDIAGEKCHNAIRNDCRHLQEEVAIVTNHS